MSTHKKYDAAPVFEPNPRLPQELLQLCPLYQETPLVSMPLQSGPVLVKDERDRFDSGSFKALGGVYAVARLVAMFWQKQFGRTLTPSTLLDAKVQEFAKSLTFVCASAGNHGLAVATGARLSGARARVHLAETVPETFAELLQARGAEIIRSGRTYDDSIAAAIADADKTGAVLLADSSWPGYSLAPSLVMEGYTVIAEELRRYFEARQIWPSHVFLQAGVGGLAAAISCMIRRNWAVQPTIVIVEPDAAPCLWQSHLSGKPTSVTGPVSNMGRLDCKAPSHLAFAALQAASVQYMQISDNEASNAATLLDQKNLTTSPSGAAGFAGLQRWTRDKPVDIPALPLIIISEKKYEPTISEKTS